MQTQQEICDEIETRAEALGVSISHVCREAPVNRGTFQRWKTGQRQASVNMLRRCVVVLDGLDMERATERGWLINR